MDARWARLRITSVWLDGGVADQPVDDNDSELTGTRLQRPMVTDWSAPLAISS